MRLNVLMSKFLFCLIKVSFIRIWFPIHSRLYSVDNTTFSTPGGIRKSLFSSITSANIAHRALKSLITLMEKESTKFDATLLKELNIHKRQNGLMKYGPEEIFTLTYMQKHCAIISDEYKSVKVFAEGKLPERQM